jgi:hypothetical protein
MVILSVLIATLLSALAFGQAANAPGAKKQKNVIATDRCWSKGGIGIVGSVEDKVNGHFYIVVKSAKNKAVLEGGGQWIGKSAGTREVAIFFENKIWSPPNLPSGFDMSKAVVISFEGDVIRLFQFNGMHGCYYDRIPEN